MHAGASSPLFFPYACITMFRFEGFFSEFAVTQKRPQKVGANVCSIFREKQMQVKCIMQR